MASRMTQEGLFREGTKLVATITRLEVTAADVKSSPYPIRATIPPNNSEAVTVSKAVAGRLLRAEINRLNLQLVEVKKGLAAK